MRAVLDQVVPVVGDAYAVGANEGQPWCMEEVLRGAVYRVAQPCHEVLRVVVAGILREELAFRVGALDAADLAALVGDAA